MKAPKNKLHMRYDLATDIDGLATYLSDFLNLIDRKRWRKRATLLAKSMRRSAFEAKVVTDYHWLELALSAQIVTLERSGTLDRQQIDVTALDSLYFASTIAEVYKRLSKSGQHVLEGRIRDCLKARTGFSSLYLEMDIAQTLINAGFDVEFTDIEGASNYDLKFSKSDFNGEVECKSLSADAGRKINRKDFYRFVDTLGQALEERAFAGYREIILITLQNRLPADVDSQTVLRADVLSCLRSGPKESEGAFYTIKLESCPNYLSAAPVSDATEYYNAIRNIYGDNIHVSGAFTEGGLCLIIMRSLREDDTSKPLLNAMRKAANQLSGKTPGFIAIQFDDIGPTELLNQSLRRKTGILSYALFQHYRANYIAATNFRVYGGLTLTPKGIGRPAFAIPNPAPKFSINPDTAYPLIDNISDAEFTGLLGKTLSKENISYIPI